MRGPVTHPDGSEAWLIRNGGERGIGMYLELSAGLLEVCREPFSG